MNRPHHLLALGWLLAGAAMAACGEPAPPVPAPREDQAAPPRGHLQDVRGPVSVKRAHGDEWIAAREGMALFANDQVATGAEGAARVAFVSGGSLALAENALVGLTEPRALHQERPTDVTVHRGRVEATLDRPDSQSLSVETPAAIVSAGREVVFQ